MQIGIGTPLPLIGNLPSQGQGGGGITFTYVNEDYCSNASDPSPTVVPAGGTFSELNSNSGLVINATTGVIDISASTSNASYIAKYTAPGGESANFLINISTYPTVTITGNSSACEGTATTLTVASGYSYQWYKDSVLISGATSNTYNPDVNTVGSSVYYVIATNTFSGITCTDQSANFSFTVNEVPVASISASSTTICTGDTATLTANVTGGSGSYTYLWSTGATTSNISVTAAATYTVTVTDTNSTCTDQASQAITVSTTPTAIASIDNDYALEFDGQSYVLANSNENIEIDGDLTISAWIKPSTSGIQGLVAKRSSSIDYQLYTDASNPPKLQFFRSGGSTITSSDSLTLNEWNHIAITVKSGIFNGSTLFINGQPSGNGTFTISSTTANLFIGTLSTTSNFFTGDMDEVAIWDTKLSSCDIEGIYNATTSVNGQPKSANLLDANTTIPAPVYWNRMGD